MSGKENGTVAAIDATKVPSAKYERWRGETEITIGVVSEPFWMIPIENIFRFATCKIIWIYV
jgi:hypothetical protein